MVPQRFDQLHFSQSLSWVSHIDFFHAKFSSEIERSTFAFPSILRFRLKRVTAGVLLFCHGVPSTCSPARILVLRCIHKSELFPNLNKGSSQGGFSQERF